MSFRIFRCLISVAIAPVFTACVDLTGLNDVFGTPLLGIGVGSDQGQVVEVGDTIRYTATGDVGGVLGMFMYDRLLDARWSVSDPTIAQLQPLPPPPPDDSLSPTRTLIRGVRPGTTQVAATARGVRGEATVRVIPMISAIQMTLARDTLAVGDTIRVDAAAHDIGGAPITGVPLTFGVHGGVELRGFDNAGARVVATTAGPATLSATFRRVSREVAFVVVPRAP